MAKDIYGILAERVRQERARAGLTLEALAEKAGVSDTFVAHIETGLRKPSLETVHRLARALDVSLAELLKEELHPLPKSDAPYLNRFVQIVRGKTSRQKDGLLRILKTASDVLSR